MRHPRSLALASTLAALALGTSPARAAYNLGWSTLDAGGGTFSTGGGYSLGGTVGQPDAGACAGGAYALIGGFWGPGSGAATAAPWRDPNTLAPAGAPPAFRLSPCAPNPFVTQTQVAFELPGASAVDLRVYDVAGRRVRTLEVGARPAGRYRVDWTGVDDADHRLPAGIYFVRLQAGTQLATRKVVLTH